MRRWAVNRGGWPLKVKTIFDAKAHRTAVRATETLANAQMHLHNTTPVWSHLLGPADRASYDALNILTEAIRRVVEAERAANDAAKAIA